MFGLLVLSFGLIVLSFGLIVLLFDLLVLWFGLLVLIVFVHGGDNYHTQNYADYAKYHMLLLE